MCTSAFAQFATSFSQIKSAFGTPKLVRPTLHWINSAARRKSCSSFSGRFPRWLAKSGFGVNARIAASEGETDSDDARRPTRACTRVRVLRVFVAALSTRVRCENLDTR